MTVLLTVSSNVVVMSRIVFENRLLLKNSISSGKYDIQIILQRPFMSYSMTHAI